MRLSDSIETFIKTLLAEDEPEVELKRNELAEYFGCAPSQINYVHQKDAHFHQAVADTLGLPAWRRAGTAWS